MFATALTAAISLFQMPADVQLPAGLEDRSIQMVLQATETHFVAHNTASEVQLLLFGNDIHGVVSTVHVQPGMHVVFPFADGASDDVWIEVVSPSDIGLTNTGAISVLDLRGAAERTIWVEAGAGYALGWQNTSSGLRHVHPVGGLVPTRRGLSRTGLRDFSLQSSTHVPVISPNDDQRPPKPPKIEEEALPPI
ncbi:MAG: hypothetical protein GY711_03595 [bacterium]|nr:hypothetical protein [bacterium]